MSVFQRGFAPIALVILLLFGITAGTLLVQQRTNLLPKAAEPRSWDWPFLCSFPDSQTLAPAESTKYKSNCPDDQYVKFSHCQYSPNNLIVTAVDGCQAAYDSLRRDEYTFYCKWSNECPASPPAPAAPVQRTSKIKCTDAQDPNRFCKEVFNNFLKEAGIVLPSCQKSEQDNSIWAISSLNPVCDPANFNYDYGCRVDPSTNQYENCGLSSKADLSDVCVVKDGKAQCIRPAAPAAGQTPGISAGTCTAKQITDLRNCPTVDNKPRCIITEAGSPQCQYTEDFSDECNRAHYEKCQTNASTYNLETSLCYVIDGVPRCEYKGKDAGCNPEDKICENGTVCKIFTKKVNNKDINYSACVKSSSPAQAGLKPAAAPAAGGPAGAQPAGPAAPAAQPAAPEKFACKGTDLVDTKLPGNGCIAKCREKPEGSSGLCSIDMTACEGLGSDQCIKSAQEGKLTNTICGSITDNGRTFTGVVDKDHPKVVYDTCNGGALDCKPYGNIASCRTVPPATAATTQCGFDKDGLKIPCYKIGVFSPEDLLSTEAGARIASERYTQFSEIITKLTGQINADIIAAANAKLKAAQDAALACMNGTSTTPATTTTSTGSTSSTSLTPCDGSGSTCPLSTKACHLSRINSKWYCVDKGVFNKDFYCDDISEEFSNRCPSNYPTCDRYGQCRNSANAILPGTPKQIQ